MLDSGNQLLAQPVIVQDQVANDQFCIALGFHRKNTDSLWIPRRLCDAADSCAVSVRDCINCQLSRRNNECVPEFNVTAHLDTTSTAQR